MSEEFRCRVAECRHVGAFKDVPSVAAHAWARHAVEFADTYQIFGYRDEDEKRRGPVAKARPRSHKKKSVGPTEPSRAKHAFLGTGGIRSAASDLIAEIDTELSRLQKLRADLREVLECQA